MPRLEVPGDSSIAVQHPDADAAGKTEALNWSLTRIRCSREEGARKKRAYTRITGRSFSRVMPWARTASSPLPPCGMKIDWHRHSPPFYGAA